MNKRTGLKAIAVLVAFLGAVNVVVYATSFTDVATPNHYFEMGLKDLCVDLDANFALIEAGTATTGLASNKVWIGDAAGAAAQHTVSGDLTTGTNGAWTIADSAVDATDIALAANLILQGNSGGTSEAYAVTGDIAMTGGVVTAIGDTFDYSTNIIVEGSTTSILRMAVTNGLVKLFTVTPL